MVLVVLLMILALLAAGAVLLVASVAGGSSGTTAQFLADLRAGLGRRAPEDADEEPEVAGRPVGTAALVPTPRGRDSEEEAVAGLDQLFTVGRPDRGYVDSDELTETLGLATQRAARGVAMIRRR